MPVKTMRYHPTPSKTAKLELTTPNAGEDVEQKEFSFIASGNAKWYSHFGRQFGCYRMIQQLRSLVFIQRSRNLYPHRNLS